jgi:hypothetical protein
VTGEQYNAMLRQRCKTLYCLDLALLGAPQQTVRSDAGRVDMPRPGKHARQLW